MWNILVTGSTGFVGANLVRELVEQPNTNVSIIIRKSSDIWRIKDIMHKFHKIFNSDLDDTKHVEEAFVEINPDYVYHVATYGGFPGQVDTQQTIKSNLIATMTLIDLSVKYDVKQFINTGSSSEYGIKDAPMKESDYCEPVNFYGITKLAATNYCSMIGRQQTNLKTCTLRLFSPYGDYEDDSRLYPSIKSSLMKNESPRLSRPYSVRDFIPISNVINIYLEILKVNYQSGDIINVGSGKQSNIEDFYYQIAKELDKENIIPIWGEATSRANEPKSWVADISKLKSLISID
ncbi:CDP-abequose synthase [Paenibacillus marchantiophytorum]|uniref:CDP-abequose synthase n=1 Tax=Paenibacillus marchantiophytorum TaxID=1619310 RepID=A0ABQ2BS07_9BACL|nr:NAD-dependent epimerase/dehydratase family protein [Paenibacillus marchantiophytorum]GGI46220.1 CDP-abequose synthase [Paenibacillus marchantiophytorum]